MLECGPPKGPVETYRSREFHRPAVKLRMEIAVNDAFLETAVEAVIRHGCTDESGQVGDSQVFVLGLEEYVRVLTGKRRTAAVEPSA